MKLKNFFVEDLSGLKDLTGLISILSNFPPQQAMRKPRFKKIPLSSLLIFFRLLSIVHRSLLIFFRLLSTVPRSLHIPLRSLSIVPRSFRIALRSLSIVPRSLHIPLRSLFIVPGSLLIVLCSLFAVSCTPSETIQTTDGIETFRDTDHFVHKDIDVYHRKTGSDIISVKIFVRGGTSNYVDRFAGIEYLSLRIAVEGGTILYSPEEYRDQARSIGAAIRVGRPSLDYSVISMKCPGENFTAGWDMLTQPLMNPVFKADYFKIFRGEQIAAIAVTQEGEAGLLTLSRKNLFSGRNYEKSPLGSPESLEFVTPAEVSDFFKSLITRDRLAVVVHGFVPREKIVEKIDQTIAGLPSGFFHVKDETLKPLPRSVIHRYSDDQPLSGIAGVFPGPQGGTEESLCMKLAMMVLHYRLTLGMPGNIFASYEESRQSFCTVAAFGENSDRALDAILHELRLMVEEGIGEEELQAQKLRLSTERSMLMEEMEGHCHLMGLAAVQGDWTAAVNFHAWLESLDRKDVENAFRNWCRGICWTIQGNPEYANLDLMEVPLHLKK